MRYPEFLKEHGTIGFVAPSFGCVIEPYHSAFQNALRKWETQGYKTNLGPNCVASSGIGISNEPKLGGEEINDQLEKQLNERLAMAGMEIVEARINYLAYAPEIAAVMLRRQQASAIISAREKIVEGAVSMVKLALDKLSSEEIVELDEEKKAAMVSNLLVVLCADEPAQPVVNSGTLNH